MAYKKALLLFIKGEFGNSFELMHNQLRNSGWGSPSYTSLRYAIAAILDIPSIMEDITSNIARQQFNHNETEEQVYSTILTHKNESTEENLMNVRVYWYKNGKVNPIRLGGLITGFNIDIAGDMSEHRNILKCNGLF